MISFWQALTLLCIFGTFAFFATFIALLEAGVRESRMLRRPRLDATERIVTASAQAAFTVGLTVLAAITAMEMIG